VRNTAVVAAEEAEYEQLVAEQYAQITTDFKPPTPPLWTGSSGFWTRSRAANQRVVLSVMTRGYFLTAALLLLNLLFVYRFPSVVHGLWRLGVRSGPRYNKHLFNNGLREYGLDGLALVTMIYVMVVSPPRSLAVVRAVYLDLVERTSVSAARRSVFGAVPKAHADLAAVARLPCKRTSYAFAVIAALWGALVPLELFEALGNIVFGTLLLLAFSSFPFVAAFFIGPDYRPAAAGPNATNATGANATADDADDDGSGLSGVGDGSLAPGSNSSFAAAPYDYGSGGDMTWVVAAYLLAVGVFVVAGAVCRRRTNPDGGGWRPAPTSPGTFKFATTTWSTLALWAGTALELLQISGLVFQLDLPVAYGAELRTAANYLLVTTASFDTTFWVVVVLWVLMYFVASAPTILGSVMPQSGLTVAQITDNGSWRLAARVFSSMLEITVLQGFMHGLACDPVGGQLLADDSIACWTGTHMGKAWVGG
jgi:hypothetical protein